MEILIDVSFNIPLRFLVGGALALDYAPKRSSKLIINGHWNKGTRRGQGKQIIFKNSPTPLHARDITNPAWSLPTVSTNNRLYTRHYPPIRLYVLSCLLRKLWIPDLLPTLEGLEYCGHNLSFALVSHLQGGKGDSLHSVLDDSVYSCSDGIEFKLIYNG